MLNNASPLKIFLYHALTAGLYFFYWASKSRAAINASAGQTLIPSTWLLAVPFAGYWWMWQYGRALEHVSYKRIKAADTFLFFILATNFVWIIWQPLSAFDPKWLVDKFTLTKVLLFVFAFVVVTAVVGVGFFCAVIQGKINKVRKP